MSGRNSLCFIACCLAIVISRGVQADVFPDPSIAEGSFAGSDRTHGKKNALYLVLREAGGPALPLSRLDQIRASEVETREFFAADSGGAFDLYYDEIIEVPMFLNPDGSLPSGWRNIAEDYVDTTHFNNGTLGQTTDYYALVFDVSSTAIGDPGFTGFYYGGRDLAVRTSISTNSGQQIIDHELAHRLSGEHARALRPINNSSYKSYVWDESSSQYVGYSSATQPYNPTPYGVYRDEYGNRFDILGGNNHGSIRAYEKYSDYEWLTDEQVPDMYELGEGVHRIYAHDELSAVVDEDGDWGVSETYDPNAIYGITFQRTAERFDPSLGEFEAYTQRIAMEYRAGRDGILFYQDDALLDLDPEGGTSASSLEKELEVGNSISDIEFGMSMFYVNENGIDFASYNPPAPGDPTAIRSEWFYFTVLSTGTNAIGSYVEFEVSLISPLNGIIGDLDQNGFVTLDDLTLFVDGWKTDTTSMQPSLKYLNGDIDLNGITDIRDAIQMRTALHDAGFIVSDSDFFAAVPEPTTVSLLGFATAVAGIGLRRRQVPCV